MYIFPFFKISLISKSPNSSFLTFKHFRRSSSSSQRSSTTPGRSHRITRVTTRRSREPSHSMSTSRRSRDPHNTSGGKVYNSKDYEDEDDNLFAASDEDLKYRMKALALYNGELDESLDMSVVSRRSRR